MHYRQWRYIAIHTICCKIGQLTPNLAYLEGVETPRTQHFRKALSVVKPHENLEPIEHDHPLRRLIDNPNPVDTSFDLFYESQMFLELCGVTYTWVVPNAWGQPCELWTIPAHWVWPRTGGAQYVPPDNPDADRLIQYYEVRPWGGMGSAGILKFPPDEVIMERWKSPINKIDGWSPSTAGAQWIDTEESITKSRWSQFINQARPEFHVELGEGYEDPDDDMIARIESKFMRKYQGEFNFGKPIFTPPGAKVTPLSFSPTEMSYFQSEDQIRDMLLSLSNVPGAAVGLVKEMTYGSVLATLAGFCSFCINPRLTMRGQTWNKQLAPRFQTDRVIKLWYDDCVPHDPQQINADLQLDFTMGIITPNEARALRGRKPFENGGDDPLVNGPGGLIPLPLNSGEDLSPLADLVPNLGASQETESEAQPPEEGSAEGTNPASDLGISNPNGPPGKSLRNGVHKNGKPKQRRKDLESDKDDAFMHGRQFKVRIVNAGKLRSSSTDFEEFGNVGTHVEFPMIPWDEVWIADNVEPVEHQYLIANGERQLRVIGGQATTDEAVSAGLSAEKFERDKHEPKEYKEADTNSVRVSQYGTIKDHDEEVQVWLIDARKVRDTFETPFTEGANAQALTYVPSGEIWLDHNLDKDELPFVLLHERVERCLMKHSYLTYEEAHAEASRIEFIARGKRGKGSPSSQELTKDASVATV